VVRASGDRDLEVIPIGHDALERPRARTSHWSARRVRLALVAKALLASVGLAISGLIVRTHRARAAPTPRPTAEEINARLSVQRSEVIVVVGDKIIARPISSSNGTGPLGHVVSVHLGPVEDLAWLDDETLVARVDAKGLVVVDGASGITAHEPDFVVGARGLAFIQLSTG
jgi:hypothetical protein